MLMLLATAPGEVGADLLGAIRDAERWVEQETVAEEVPAFADASV